MTTTAQNTDKAHKVTDKMKVTIERKADDKVAYLLQVAECREELLTAEVDMRIATKQTWEKVLDITVIASASKIKLTQMDIATSMQVSQGYVSRCLKTVKNEGGELAEYDKGLITIDGKQVQNLATTRENEQMAQAREKLTKENMIPTETNLIEQVKDMFGTDLTREQTAKYLEHYEGKKLTDRKTSLVSAINGVVNHKDKNTSGIESNPSDGDKKQVLIDAFKDIIAENSDNGVLLSAMRKTIEGVKASQLSDERRKTEIAEIEETNS